jgi:hypothetical protein
VAASISAQLRYFRSVLTKARIARAGPFLSEAAAAASQAAREHQGGGHGAAGTGEVDFAAGFARDFPRLAGYCAGLVDDRDIGADLAQEALTRIWASGARSGIPGPTRL